jgi:lactate permease
VLGLGAFDLSDAPGGPVAGSVGALAEAGFTTATILWIIVPALAIHRLQVATGAVERLRSGLTGLSADPRLTALMVAWFFALLLEGAAGFGTAAALAAPFLVVLGLSPLTAVSAALLGHTVGVSFGAVGTPILPQISATGLDPTRLSAATAIYGAVIGGIMVGAVAASVRRLGSGRGDDAGAVRLGAWVVLAGVGFLVPYLVIATVVGPELPTLGGAVVGGGLFAACLLAVRRVGGGSVTDDGSVTGGGAVSISAAAPYLALVGLVLATRLIGPLRDLLQSVELRWALADGAYGGSMQVLYHPGTMLLLALLIGAVWQGASVGQVRSALGRTVRSVGPVVAALVVMLGLARILVHAGMVDALAVGAASLVGVFWPALAPAVGALGTFVTGSATASNALLTDLQASTAEGAGLAPVPVLGAQGFGAAMGNAIAPHNVIAAAAVVGLAGREGEILRRTAPVVAISLVLGGALALLLTTPG